MIANRIEIGAVDTVAIPARTTAGVAPKHIEAALRSARDVPSAEPQLIRHSAVDEVDAARAREYALLSVLLSRAPDAAFLKRLRTIPGDPSPLGAAHAALAAAAADFNTDSIDREYFDLFVGLGRGELLPYGSYYLTGFLNERPLARLREDFRSLGIVREQDQVEPEDHAAVLCEIMARLADGNLPAPVEAQERLFQKHLAPWITRFFVDLERNQRANFYRHVGTVGRVFIEIEMEAFALPA